MVSVQLDELPDVFGDALVGVVGGVAQKLHAIVVASRQPVAEIVRVIQRRQRICSHWLR